MVGIWDIKRSSLERSDKLYWLEMTIDPKGKLTE